MKKRTQQICVLIVHLYFSVLFHVLGVLILSYSKYPVSRTVYTQTTGKLLEHIIKKIFLELKASKVNLPYGQANDVDIKVWDRKGKLVIVGEIINWSIFSLLTTNRRNIMITNLTQHPCNRVFIYTNLSKSHLTFFTTNNIDQIKIGYQVLHNPYFNFYQNKNQVINRKGYCLAVKNDIKKKIQVYLKRRKISI